MNRRDFLLSTAILGFALTGQAAPALAQGETPRPGGTLRFVMKYEPPTLSSINNTSTPLTSGKIFDGLSPTISTSSPGRSSPPPGPCRRTA